RGGGSGRAGLVLLRASQGQGRGAGGRGATGHGDGAGRGQPGGAGGGAGRGGGAAVWAGGGRGRAVPGGVFRFFRWRGAAPGAARVVFSEFQVSAPLPAYQQTTVRLNPAEAGEFGFACGMNMIHGTLIVEAATNGAGNGGSREGEDHAAASPGSAAAPAVGCASCAPPAAPSGETALDARDGEVAERQAEI